MFGHEGLISRRVALAGFGLGGCASRRIGADPRAGAVVYANALAGHRDIAEFKLEGQARISFPNQRLRMENALAPELGQSANFVLWCAQAFPDNVSISWKFWPLREPGLAMLFFSASGQNGADILDPSLAARAGRYDQYISGDIRALHVSYFRRREISERAFNVCNLRKTPGFHLVAQGADPIPAVGDAQPPYQIEVLKQGARVVFRINDLTLFDWTDDGVSAGEVLGGGAIGLRQLAPLMAEYSDLVIRRLEA